MKATAQAGRVGEIIPVARLHPAVRTWAKARRPAKKWCVAFSGGADSLALVYLLWAHWPARRDEMIVLHFNHRLRGRASDADERFCRRVCRDLGLPVRVGKWPGRRRRASEAEARTARHGFFAREMKKIRGQALWLAHQQDDIAEGMLMRLARGSGTGGLAAPRPVQVVGDGRVHLRPLLGLKKAELVAALRTAGAAWREDSSNDRDDHFRNRVRRAVLPAWRKAAQRDAVAGAALARERLEEDDDALETWLERLRPIGPDRSLNLKILANAPRAILRRALHRWLLVQRRPADLSRQGFDLLLAAVERGKTTRFSLGPEGFAVIRQGKLLFQKG